jgi:hypothetical protein
MNMPPPPTTKALPQPLRPFRLATALLTDSPALSRSPLTLPYSASRTSLNMHSTLSLVLSLKPSPIKAFGLGSPLHIPSLLNRDSRNQFSGPSYLLLSPPSRHAQRFFFPIYPKARLQPSCKTAMYTLPCVTRQTTISSANLIICTTALLPPSHAISSDQLPCYWPSFSMTRGGHSLDHFSHTLHPILPQTQPHAAALLIHHSLTPHLVNAVASIPRNL